MKATYSYRQINESPLKGIILYYSNVVLENIKPVKLKTVISEIQTGKTPPKANSKYYQSQDIDWFKPSDIGRSKYLEEAEEKFSEIALKEKKGTMYPKNTLLIIGIGGGVGRVSLLRNEGSSNQQITGLLFKDEIFPEWAYYYYLVREDYVKSQAKSMSFPILNQAKIKNLDFKYPSKNEQIEVCKFLDHCWECYLKNEIPRVEAFQIPVELRACTLKQFSAIKLDEGIKGVIENQKGLITALKQSILREAIQGKLTADWREQNPNTEPASELLKRIKAEKAQLIKEKKIRKEKPLPPISEDEIPFELPDGWVWCSMDDITTINGGFAFKSSQYINEGVRVIRISDFNEDGFSNDKIVRYKYTYELEPYILKEENILMAMTGGTVGKSLLVKDLPEKMVVNQRVATINILSPISPSYINCVIPTNLIQDVIKEAKNSTNDNISMGNIKGFLIPLPPLEEQTEIVAKVELIKTKINDLGSEITQSEQHAQILMQAVLKEAFERKKEEVYES